jgi:hypothetical protein
MEGEGLFHCSEGIGRLLGGSGDAYVFGSRWMYGPGDEGICAGISVCFQLNTSGHLRDGFSVYSERLRT